MTEIPVIHQDIRKASTLPGSFYTDTAIHELIIERVFRRSWHYAIDRNELTRDRSFHPVVLLDGVLNEPVVMTWYNGDIRALSNVCTHRGAIIVDGPGQSNTLRCPYHGRCFDLTGKYKSMPGFAGVANFPALKDDLTHHQLSEALGMCFVSLDPKVSLEALMRPILNRVGWLPLHELTFDEASSIDYNLCANWALYCDNYLEGLHIPFVHPGLNATLEFGSYQYELSSNGSLQIGVAKDQEQVFDLPDGHPDAATGIFAYYFWLFPNIMMNFYPWGLSLNIVEPRGPAKTRVRFRTYLFDKGRGMPDHPSLATTELEDERIVESVQRGIASRYYTRGRYSPSHEKAVHHFHRLLTQCLH